MIDHQGKALKLFIKSNEINVEKTLLPKLNMSRQTLYNLYKEERIDAEYIKELLKAGIDFLGQSATTRLKQSVSFPQKESGLAERVKQLETTVTTLQTALLDLYSRLPKPE